MTSAVISAMLKSVDDVFDELLGKLGCNDGSDAALVAHWQEGNPGFRIQVTRKSDGKSVTKFVGARKIGP